MLLELDDKDFPTDMDVVIKEFDCDSEHDLALLWGQFDSLISSRSKPDVVNAAVRNHPELDHVQPTKANEIITGLIWALNKGNKINYNLDQRQALVHRHVDFLVFASDFAGNELMRRAAVIAAMYHTWKTDAAKATEFWTLVRDEAGLTPECPTRTLQKFLRQNIGGRESRNSNVREKWIPMAYYIKSVVAWNAWIKGKKTNLHYYERAYIDDNGKVANFLLPDRV